VETDRYSSHSPYGFILLSNVPMVGMHKHFRMLAIFESFRSNGFGSGKKAPPNHVRIPGIWAKLNELYDLETLDERENVHAGFVTITSTPNSSSESTPEPPTEFKLPIDPDDPEVDFGALLWARRFANDRSESPQLIEGLNNTRSEPGVVLSGKDGEDEDSSQAEEESTPSPVGKASGKPAKKPAKPPARRNTRRR
jgi:MRG-binding protein